MAVFSPDLYMNVEVTARFIHKGNDKPIHGKEYEVKLFDKDFFDDDFIGQAHPGQNGVVHISFNPSKLYRNEPIIDRALEFYFVLYKNGKEVFKSQVMKEADLEFFEKFKMGKGEIIDLGTFLVDA